MANTQAVLQRRYANVFDLSVDGPAEEHGVCPGSEYIGGYGGVGWYEYYKDAETGEVYKVHCSDGVDGNKHSHTSQDRSWLIECHIAIIMRCHFEAALGRSEIYISRNERVIMNNFIHSTWLESAPGKRDGVQSKSGLDGGLVGHCHGVQVICDLSREDNLPPRMEDSTIRMARVFAHLSHPELGVGEVFVGNWRLSERRMERWRTERFGQVPIGLDGSLVEGSRPIIIKKSELDYEWAALQRFKKPQDAAQN